MARSFGLALGTVRHAMAELEQEGVVRREHGRGTFVSEEMHGRLRQDTGSYVLLAVDTRSIDVSLLHGFELGCKGVHHHMTVCNSENDLLMQGNLVLQLLEKEKDVAGVAIYPVTSPATPYYQIAPLRKAGVPVVFLHRAVTGIKAPTITIPHEEMGRLAGKALLDQGHRRVAMFSGLAIAGTDEEYQRGFRGVLQSSGLELPDEFVYIAKTQSADPAKREKQVLEALKFVLGEDDPPTAIWCTSGGIDELVYMHLHELGLRVPEDISLMGLGEADGGGPVSQRITRVVYSDSEVGRLAVELLDEMASGKRALDDTKRIVMPVSLIDGKTLGPVCQRD